MVLPCYLAMTAAEFAQAGAIPPKVAWMACHFSSYGTGLSNLPASLPPKAILIVNDRIPISGHDPDKIELQLRTLVTQFDCDSILLDLQRPNEPETAALCAHLVTSMPCPVAVSEHYAQNLTCPVFLAPPPLRMPLSDYLAPWQGREIWLEAALCGEEVVITENGAQVNPCAPEALPSPQFTEDALCCQYHWTIENHRACFLFQRTLPMLSVLLDRAKDLGVCKAVGLFQQLGN